MDGGGGGVEPSCQEKMHLRSPFKVQQRVTEKIFIIFHGFAG